jgi:hypothetical protein
MPTPIDSQLYQKAKEQIYAVYKKPSAYRSMALVKRYKELGGRYKDDNKPKNLKRWINEEWSDANKVLGIQNAYPVLRPTKKINSKTPTLLQDIPLSRLKKQSKLKQVYKGDKNLPPFA